MRNSPLIHREGPGLRELNPYELWYGGGYCGLCGDRATEAITCAVVPRVLRWWDGDDGWKTGILCLSCAGYAASRGPQPGDYAYRERT